MLAVALLGYLCSVLLREPGTHLPLFDDWLTNAVQLVASALCLGRALLPGRNRVPALVLGSGLLLWSIGNVIWTTESVGGASPVPSAADWFFLSMYPLTYLAVMLLLHERGRIPAIAWLNGLVGGLGVASAAAAFAFDPILHGTGGAPLTVAVDLAYPLGDLVLLALVATALTASRSTDARWLLLAGGCALFGAADTAYLFLDATGVYQRGGLVDVGWPLAVVLISAAMWRPATGADRVRPAGGAHLVPMLGLLAVLGIVVYGDFRPVNRLALILGAATIAIIVLRSIAWTKEVGALDVERRLHAQAEAARAAMAEREAENRALATRLAGLLDAAPVAIVETDLDDRVVRWNRAAESIYGWTEAQVTGRLNPNPDIGFSGQFSHLRADGGAVDVDVVRATLRDSADRRVGTITVVTDVSSRKRLEVELRHAQKLESVGRLAAGIAHEINTPVQFIGDNVSFLHRAFTNLLEYLRAPEQERDRAAEELDIEFLVEEVPDAIAQTRHGVDRVASIVRAMKFFGHPNDTEKIAVNLNEAVQNTIIVAFNELKYVAEVRTELAELPPVPAHLGDINQVVLNLLVNAAHAIGDRVTEGDRGTITVRTRHSGEHAVIEVADTGTGIPSHVVDKIFDPFFTTKPVGTGTGQGLALVRSLIVERHGGRIDFETEPGAGTTFSVWLPLG